MFFFGVDGTGNSGRQHERHDRSRENTAERFANVPDPADITTAPVSGIGDKARLDTMNPDGRNSELWFTAGRAERQSDRVLIRRRALTEMAPSQHDSGTPQPEPFSLR